MDCSKQRVQPEHRAGASAAVCTCVPGVLNPAGQNGGWSVSPTQNEGRGLSLKEEEHKILSNMHTMPFRKHFPRNYYCKASPSISTNRKLRKKHTMDQDTLHEICFIAYAGTLLKSLQRDHGMAVVNTF